MAESNAYLSLKGAAPQVLTLILLKRQFEKHKLKKGRVKSVCVNCDSLTFTYIEAEKKYGITQPRLTRAIDELLAKGFITCKHNGGAYKQDKSIYGLIDKYLFWKPGVVFEKRTKDPAGRGFRRPKKR
jgi:hypothetical protein